MTVADINEIALILMIKRTIERERGLDAAESSTFGLRALSVKIMYSAEDERRTDRKSDIHVEFHRRLDCRYCT